jgi:outer membrane protein assembly factor BamE
MKRVIPFLALALLAACSVTDRLHPYRPDIRQGNYVTQEMVSQLKPGMSREQVRFVLGTPLLNDVFHADRWDYLYRLQAGRDGAVKQRRLAVFFKDDKLARVDGDVEAAEAADSGNQPALPKNRVIDITAPAAK